MNYANMIEEKNLKKTFIIATLVSTLIGTFTSAESLYNRIQMKKQNKEQAAVDSKQSKEIDELRKQIEDRETKLNQKPIEGGVPRDEVEEELVTAGPMIRREYNGLYDRVGNKFAIGDTITQNQLQQNIIQLQQTVIHILQEALYRPEGLAKGEVAALLSASENARRNTIEALDSQYKRMITAGGVSGAPPPPQLLTLPSIAPSTKTTKGSNAPPPPSARPSLLPSMPSDDGSPLYCKYSQHLQTNASKPLFPSFSASGDKRCPVCSTTIGIEPSRAWKITKDVEHSRATKTRKNSTTGKEETVEEIVVEEKTWHVTNRFVVKCHRQNGEFACVLCSENRNVDTIWESMKGLVGHVQRVHGWEELRGEVDVREVG
ncbi:hypothetical protein K402DRAFT_334043 [Aulographum hederae CBS 113979]|uniref:Uncharacterized protein n=1 Tax=Aulographum hederae CBS 113979 TaxID=1176131 RepID=A0A6G1GXK4_9PEZI|nr:hypothetical protein K402DRAFT_334043 [Aulographum hederae CBS 113979]